MPDDQTDEQQLETQAEDTPQRYDHPDQVASVYQQRQQAFNNTQAPEPEIYHQPNSNPDVEAYIQAKDQQQAQRIQAATQKQAQSEVAGYDKYLKSQGVQYQRDETGQEHPVTHEDGSLAYKPTVIDKIAWSDTAPNQNDQAKQLWGDQGAWVQRVRDDRGNIQEQNILDQGVHGKDYHRDPETGEYYVDTGNGQRQWLGARDEQFLQNRNLAQIREVNAGWTSQAEARLHDLGQQIDQQKAILKQANQSLNPPQDTKFLDEKIAADTVALQQAKQNSGLGDSIIHGLQVLPGLGGFQTTQQKAEADLVKDRQLRDDNLKNPGTIAQQQLLAMQQERQGIISRLDAQRTRMANLALSNAAMKYGLPAVMQNPLLDPETASAHADFNSNFGPGGTQAGQKAVYPPEAVRTNDDGTKTLDPAFINDRASALAHVLNKSVTDTIPIAINEAKSQGFSVPDDLVPKQPLYRKASDGSIKFGQNDPTQAIQQAVANGDLSPEKGHAMLSSAIQQGAQADNGVGAGKDFAWRIALSTARGINSPLAGLARFFGAKGLADTLQRNVDLIDEAKQAGLKGTAQGENLVNPGRNDTVLAQAGETAGSVAAMTPAMLLGGPVGNVVKGVAPIALRTLLPYLASNVPLALQSIGEAGEEGYANTKGTEAQRRAGMLEGAGKGAVGLVPMLLAGAAAEKAMAAGTKILPALETPWVRALSTLGTQTAGNIGASAATRAIEGGNAGDVKSSLPQDIAFAGLGALHAHEAAKFLPTAKAQVNGTAPEMVYWRAVAADPHADPAERAQAAQNAELTRKGAQEFLKRFGARADVQHAEATDRLEAAQSQPDTAQNRDAAAKATDDANKALTQRIQSHAPDAQPVINDLVSPENRSFTAQLIKPDGEPEGNRTVLLARIGQAAMANGSIPREATEQARTKLASVPNENREAVLQHAVGASVMGDTLNDIVQGRTVENKGYLHALSTLGIIKPDADGNGGQLSASFASLLPKSARESLVRKGRLATDPNGLSKLAQAIIEGHKGARVVPPVESNLADQGTQEGDITQGLQVNRASTSARAMQEGGPVESREAIQQQANDRTERDIANQPENVAAHREQLAQQEQAGEQQQRQRTQEQLQSGLNEPATPDENADAFANVPRVKSARESAQAIEESRAAEERQRQSSKGARALAEDLRARQATSEQPPQAEAQTAGTQEQREPEPRPESQSEQSTSQSETQPQTKRSASNNSTLEPVAEQPHEQTQTQQTEKQQVSASGQAEASEPKAQNAVQKQGVKPAAASRFKPTEPVHFEKPITGPSGAKLRSYLWEYTKEEYVDRLGEERIRRISDWSKADASDESGREIVHKFLVEDAQGKLHQVSLEGALRMMGYLKDSEGGKAIKNLASTLKNRAKLQMQLEHVRPEWERYNENQRQIEEAEKTIPAPTEFEIKPAYPDKPSLFRKLTIKGEGDKYYQLFRNDTQIPDAQRSVTEQYRYSKAAEKLPPELKEAKRPDIRVDELESRIAKLDKKIKQAQSEVEKQSPADNGKDQKAGIGTATPAKDFSAQVSDLWNTAKSGWFGKLGDSGKLLINHAYEQWKKDTGSKASLDEFKQQLVKGSSEAKIELSRADFPMGISQEDLQQSHTQRAGEDYHFIGLREPKPEKPNAPQAKEETRQTGKQAEGKEATKPAHEVLNTAGSVKVTAPEGASALRISTRYKGKLTEQIVSLKDINKGSNQFKGTNVEKVEAGTISKDKTFTPINGEVSVEDRNAPKTMGDGKVSFSQTGEEIKGKGANKEQAQRIVDVLARDQKNAPKVNVLSDYSELPKDVQEEYKSKGVKGFYDPQTGEVSIIASAHATPAEIASTYAHEVTGHYGLQRILGDQFDAAMAHAGMENPKEVMRIAKERGLDVKDRAQRLEAIAEYVAHESEKSDKFLPKFVNFLKDTLQKVFKGVRFQDDFVRKLIKDSSAYLRGELDAAPTAYKGEGVKFSTETPEAKPRSAVFDQLTSRETKDRIAAGYDAARNESDYHAGQIKSNIELDFDHPEIKDAKEREAAQEKDLNAMPFVIEAGGNKSKLEQFKRQIANSKDSKLAKKYEAVIQHAIDNFDELNAKRANHDAIMQNNLTELWAAGVSVGEAEDYVTRRLDVPDKDQALLPNLLFGMGSGKGNSPRYFMKGRKFETLADAIEAGYKPKSTNLADLDATRIGAAKRLLFQKEWINKWENTPSPTDGKPIIGKFESRETLKSEQGKLDKEADKVGLKVDEAGNVIPTQEEPGTGYPKDEMRAPKGYTVVSAFGRPLPVHEQFAPMFKALFGDSALRNSAAGRALLQTAAIAKHYTLVLDTFHVGRVLYKQYSGGGGNPLEIRKGSIATNIHKGLSLLEYSDADLGRAIKNGEITEKEAAWAREKRPLVEELIKSGMNVGRVADNLLDQVKHNNIPILGPFVDKFNTWLFQKLSRGAMVQTAVANFERNLTRPEFKENRERAARQTAKEMNEMFGNLQNQGVLTSKTMQDVARVLFLAPNWMESQFMNELHGYTGIGKSIKDAALKGQFTLTNQTLAMAKGVFVMLAANQIVNYITRGHSTFQNKEDDHKLDAFIPGGSRGFWFNPFEIAGEYLHAALKYLAQHENPVDVATHILSNKLSPVGRGTKELLTGRDYAGRHFLSNADRVRASVTDALPFPMPLNMVWEKDPRGGFMGTGYRATRQSGGVGASVEKQLLQSAGLKVTANQSPRSKMFAIAQPYRADRQTNDSAGEYTEMRRALDDNNTGAVKDEVKYLIGRGKSIKQITHAAGISSSGEIKPETFTGNKDREKEMLRSLSPDHREIYNQAQQDHRTNALRLLSVLQDMHRSGEIPPSAFKARGGDFGGAGAE